MFRAFLFFKLVGFKFGPNYNQLWNHIINKLRDCIDARLTWVGLLWVAGWSGSYTRWTTSFDDWFVMWTLGVGWYGAQFLKLNVSSFRKKEKKRVRLRYVETDESTCCYGKEYSRCQIGCSWWWGGESKCNFSRVKNYRNYYHLNHTFV